MEGVGAWWGPGRWALQVQAARYQAIVVLGLQVDCSYHVHPHQALLREVLFMRPNEELAGGLGGSWVLRKGVDAEKALCVFWGDECWQLAP